MQNQSDSIIDQVFSGVKNHENADAVNELLDRYNLNWTVSKQSLTLPNGTDSGFFGIVRDDIQLTYATCKDEYKEFQNSELAEMLIRLSEKTGYDIHKCGKFNMGAKVYIQLASPNRIASIGKDRTSVEGFLTGINSHDGTTSLKWGEVNLTITCQNTFMYAMRELKNKAKHTKKIHDKVELAIGEINGVIESEKSLFEKFIKLSEIPVTKKAIKNVIEDITKVDTSLSLREISEKYTTYAVNRSQELLGAVSKEMKEKGETLWGLFSGVTNYTNYAMPVPKRDDARLESIFAGSAYNINNRALELVLAQI